MSGKLKMFLSDYYFTMPVGNVLLNIEIPFEAILIEEYPDRTGALKKRKADQKLERWKCIQGSHRGR